MRDIYHLHLRHHVDKDQNHAVIIAQAIECALYVRKSRHLHVDGSAEAGAGVDGVAAELLLDTEDLVELGKTLGTGRGTGLDLAGAETDDNVGDGNILGLTGSVGDHDTPASAEGILGGLDSLGDGTDLVDLEEEGVAGLGLDGLLDESGVGDGKIIARGGRVSNAREEDTEREETYPTIWKSEVL